MELRPADAVRRDENLEALLAAPDELQRAAPTSHAGFLEGATATGEASRHPLSVRIGVWLDDRGAVRKARWRAVRDPVLRACAEAGCALLESGTRVDAAALHRASGLAHASPEYAEVVAAAIEAATMASAPLR